MFDLNAIISAAITQAVDSHMRGLVAAQDIQTQELQRMQIRLNELTQRVEMLSAGLHGQVGQQLNADLAQQLDNAEWFWARVSEFVVSDESGLRRAFEEMAEESVTDERFMRKLIRLLDFDDVVSNALDNIDLADKFDVEAAVDSALDEMDLMDYIEEDKLAEKITETVNNKDWIKDAVRELSFNISVE